MGFLWATIHVKDIKASIKFYEEVVGLTLRRQFSPRPGQELAFLGIGETEVELIHYEGETLPGNIEGISIGFSCADAQGHREKLEASGVKVSEMMMPNPTLKFFYAKDPDGVNVQFVEDLR